MGEPPAVLHRRTLDELITALAESLGEVQVLRLVEPEWLDHIEGAPRIHASIAAFSARGGTVEQLTRDAG